MTDSEQVIYFHGMPGGPNEMALFGKGISSSTSDFHVLDRVGAYSGPSDLPYFQQFAAGIVKIFPETPLRFIGFSLGASAALRTAPFLGNQVRHIDLVSAAAPLSLGSYLEGMAGETIFKLARSSSILFALLARMQSLSARWAPEALYSTIFASAQGRDRDLAEDPIFRKSMVQLLRYSLGKGLRSYRLEIELYTKEWLSDLDRVTQPVSLFHGQEDNWSPVAMATDLAQRLPNCEILDIWPGMSHYSTLREFLSNR